MTARLLINTELQPDKPLEREFYNAGAAINNVATSHNGCVPAPVLETVNTSCRGT